MIERIEAVALAGPGLRVTARDPLPVDPRVLAVAAAIRVFERYPVLRRLSLRTGPSETTVSREEVDQLLGPEGFRGLDDPERWRALLIRLVESSAAGETG